MKILLKSATIFDIHSPFHLQKKDILIENGIISSIEDSNSKKPIAEGITQIESGNLCISNGWVDLNVNNTDPGFEQRDTFNTLIKSAVYGGYTHIGLMPNSFPIVQNKGAIENILAVDHKAPISLIPYGALSMNAEGKEMAELYDMHAGGAKAFTDGNGSHVTKPLLKRALLYCKAFDGLIIHHAEENSLTEEGSVHEGLVSTALGIIGRPSIAEALGILSSVYLTEYTKGKIHFINISAKESIPLIKKAKESSLKITASVNAYNLYFNDDALMEFDSNYKVNPPIRSEEDRKALIAAVLDGTIDAITSAHCPLDEESKKLEFDLALHGMLTLPIQFQLILGAMSSSKIESWIEHLTSKPRDILGLPKSTIEIGKQACLTLFDPEVSSEFTMASNPSKSNNTPLYNKSMKGKVIGIIHKNQLLLNS